MSKNTWFVFFALGFVTLLSLPGCSWLEGLFPPPSPSPSPSPTPTLSPAPSPSPTPVPTPTSTDMDKKDFTIHLLNGETQKLSSFKGSPLLLVFFSPYCFHCQQEVPTLNEVYRRYRNRGLEMIAVCYSSGPERVSAFVNSYGVTYPVGYFTDWGVFDLYDVRGVPHHVFFNRQGNITKSVEGELSLSELVDYLKDVL
jgi:peroxiredoxin